MFKFMSSRVLFALVFIATVFVMSPAALAATKNYSVVAPDGLTLAVQESGNPSDTPVVFIH